MNKLADYIFEQLIIELKQGVIVMLPGGFKPPHAGHLQLAKKYASLPTVSEVLVLIGPKEREGITMKQSMAIWQLLLGGATNIKVEQSPNDNPMRASYEFIESAAPGTYALGSSSKGKDYDRVKSFVAGHANATGNIPAGKYNRANVNVVELPVNASPVLYKGRTDDQNGQGISASTLRQDLASDDFTNFKTNYPGIPENIVNSIFGILKKQQISEVVVNQYVGKLKAGFKAFIQSIKAEGKQTRNAFSLIVQSAAGKKKLNQQERKDIGNQLRESLKAAGLVTASMLPGGTIYFIIIRLLKLEKWTMPKSFLNKDTTNTSTSLAENTKHTLMEGGAAGHMSHPYDDLDLTFEDAANMIEAALSGKVEFAQEKLDGQNLMVTYKDGKVRAARNAGQRKNFAQNAITADQLEQMMADKPPNVRTAFVEAMRDMESAINKLIPKQKEEFFQNGKKFLNFEIIYPATTNVVAYGTTQLRLHGFKEYDMEGNVISEDSDSAILLQKAIETVQASNQKTFEIRVTDPITLQKTADYEKQKLELTKQLDTIRNTYNLGKQEKMSIYFQAWWKTYIKQKGKDLGYQIPDNTLQQLIGRWGFGVKTPNINKVKAEVNNQDFSKWIDLFDKNGVLTQQKEAKKPLEILFLKLGVYVLQNMQQLVALNPNDSIKMVRDDLALAIRQIKLAAASPDMQDDGKSLIVLKRELQKIQDIGGFDAIVPTEGVVFKYNGKLYKLTGVFAPINQIIGSIKFKR